MKNKLIELIDALREELSPNAYIKIANAIQSLPEDEPKGESIYPGSQYQPLFNHMSQEHGLTLLQGEMDEIIRVVNGMTDLPDLLPFEWPVKDGYEVVIEAPDSDPRKVVTDIQEPDELGDTACKVDGKWMVLDTSDLFLRRMEKKVWVVEWSDIGRSVFYSKLEALNWIDSQDNEATIYEATLKPVK